MSSSIRTHKVKGGFLAILDAGNIITTGYGETANDAELDAELLHNILINPELRTIWERGLNLAEYETGEI